MERALDWLNPFPQFWHSWGFCLVWEYMWSLRWSCLLKDLSHTVQGKGLSPVWTRSWIWRLYPFENSLLQNLQMYLFFWCSFTFPILLTLLLFFMILWKRLRLWIMLRYSWVLLWWHMEGAIMVSCIVCGDVSPGLVSSTLIPATGAPGLYPLTGSNEVNSLSANHNTGSQ